MAQQDITVRVTLPLNVEVQDPLSSKATLPIVVVVEEPILAIESLDIIIETSLTLSPIEINLTELLTEISLPLVSNKIESAFDTDIELKLLVNFGRDIQRTITAKDFYLTKDKVRLKLLRPLDIEFTVGSLLWMSREVASSILDQINLVPAPLVDTTPYLRPRNVDISFTNLSGKNLRNVTLQSLNLNLEGELTGSRGWSYEDRVMRQWFTDDWKTSELNIDFSNYENFVVYGSAEKRILAFVEKLKKIDTLGSQSLDADTTASLATTQKSALELERVIRGFDPYETHLFFYSDMPYSASTFYSGTEYNADSTWPKISGSAVSPYSTEAEMWLDAQLPIAQRYDENNQNYLGTNLPSHVLDLAGNEEFILFVSMIGHFFDLIKPYIDAGKYIYSRDPSPDRELSKDTIWQVASAFGTELPNKAALDSLGQYLFGDANSIATRQFTSEVWKRLLHSYVHLTKRKGTSAAIRGILHSFGVTQKQLPVREAATTTTSSLVYSDESTYALRFNPAAYIIVPWSASIRDNYAVELRFNTTATSRTTLFNMDQLWKLDIVPHPTASRYSRLEVTDAVDTTILSSSYDTYSDASFYNVVLQEVQAGALSTIELDVRQTDGQRELYRSLHSIPTASFGFTSASLPVYGWTNPQYLYLGGNSGIATNTYSGLLDEFRTWGISLEETAKEEHSFNFGSYVGNDVSDAYNYLHVMFSFNSPENIAGSFGLITNETPYFNVDGISKPFDILRADMTQLQTFGFTNIPTAPYQVAVLNRTSRYKVIVGGSASHVSNKVHIAPPAPTGSDYTLLYPKRSIVPIDVKKENVRGTNTVGIYLSPTDVVNQTVYRSFGFFNLDDYIGYPGDQSKPTYRSLQEVQNLFVQQYKRHSNVGEFIRFFDGFANSIFEYLIDFIPAKARLTRGIIIEPSVIEYSKQTLIRPVQVDGAGTRRMLRAASDTIYSLEEETALEPSAMISSDLKSYLANIGVEIQSPESTYNVHEATIVSDTHDVNAGVATHDTQIEASSMDMSDFEIISHEATPIERDHEETVVADSVLYDGGIVSTTANTPIEGDYTLGNMESTVLLNELYSSSRYPYEFANKIETFYEIGPLTDTGDIGVTQYFTQPDGIYDQLIYVRVPITSSYMSVPNGNPPAWQYGEYYTKGDVVEQVGVVDTFGNRLSGNGKLFIFTTEQQIAGAQIVKTQSFNAPQMDHSNWSPVQYIVKAYNGRHRVIFVNPTQDEILSGTAKLSEVDLSKIASDTGLRKTFNSPFIELTAGGTSQGVLQLERGFILLSMKSNKENIRIRLYGDPESRISDTSRPFGIEPDETLNVVLDIIVESGAGDSVIALNPPVQGFVTDEVLPNFVYYTIDNLDATIKNTQITFNLFILEGILKVPRGYLSRHYRFYRDNSTATKRRNYLGVLQTQDTTTDNKPPVEIFLSQGNTLTVQPGSNIIGGNETLDVV